LSRERHPASGPLVAGPGATPPPRGGEIVLALGTLAIGISLFALFFGLVAACDQL
jgi:hypothetical protein